MSAQPSGDLSQFEQMSAVTPKKAPYAILGGAILGVVLVILINWLAPNEAVDEGRKLGEKDGKAEVQAEAAPSSSSGDLEDI